MKTLCALLMALHAFLFAHFHAQRARLEFEVASIHPTPPSQEHGMSLALKLDASQVRVIALPLRDIVAAAYRLKPYQISGPDWIATTAFDVSAKMPAGETTATDRLTWSFSGNPAGVSNVLGDGSSYSFAGGKFEGRKLTVKALATELERYSPRPIVDMTRLTGAFDATFAIGPEAYGQLLWRAAINSGMVMPPQMRNQIESNADFNALPEAVEQLGLKLDARRAPIDMLVVDDVRRNPTEN